MPRRMVNTVPLPRSPGPLSVPVQSPGGTLRLAADESSTLLKPGQDLLPALRGPLDGSILNVSVSADLLRQTRELYNQRIRLGSKPVEAPGEVVSVLRDQGSFTAAVRCLAEQIERCSPEKPEARQDPEGEEDGRREYHFLRAPRAAVFREADLRREIEPDPVVTVEGVLKLALERTVRVEPRHLVLVLIGHELEQVAHHCLRELGAAGDLPLRIANRIDER